MLSRIELRGFKSFAVPTALELGPGINVIVGPNGSGKSNLSEAVVWALGEQRSARLRAPAMQEVIYSGGSSRPPAGFAEVALVLSEGAEIEAARRLTRAGEATYRLNRTACRLLDLQDALAARGLGPDSLAIIRQGQVEAICASRPADRRAILDEAAGVGMPKRRRRRAEQKLARVDERLVRARDLASEVGGRARSLERQARQAERAASLEREIESMRARLAGARACATHAALVEARRRHTAASAEVDAARELLGRARTRRDEAAAEESSATTRLRGHDALVATLRAGCERLEGRAELGAERLREAEERRERRDGERRAARERLADVEHAAAERAARLDEARLAAARAEDDLRRLESIEAEARARLKEAREIQYSLAASERLRQHEIDVPTEDRSALARRQAALLEELRVAEAGPATEAIERVQRRDEVSAGRVVRWSERETDASRAAEQARVVLAAAEDAVRTARAEVALLSSAPQTRARELPGLTDGLEVEPGYERAVAAALGVIADAPFAGGLAGGRAALERGARAAVVPAPARAPSSPPADARPLLSVVRRCPDAARAHLERLLADAWLVDALDRAPRDHPGILVTADGCALRPAEGIVTGSRGEWTRRALLSRSIEAQRIAEDAQEASREGLERAEEARLAARARRHAAERCAGRAAESATRVAAASRRHAERREAVGAELEEVRSALERAQAELVEAAEAHERARAQALAAAERSAAAEAAQSEAAKRLHAGRAADDEGRAAAALAQAAATNAEAELARTRALAGSETAGPAPLDAVERAVSAIRSAAAVMAPLFAAMSDELVERRDALARFLQERQRAEGEAGDAEGALASAVEAAHATDVEVRLADERARAAGPPPGEEDEAGDPAALEQEIAELERRRLGLGMVNALAAAELVELGERQAYIMGQVGDLERSAEALRAHLAELDATVAEGFEALFATAGERFAEVAGLLFPGGEGRLRRVSGDDGEEEGVEVEVVPAGKRPRSLSLLSGGERSLVALAFCLALAMARPAPFYLLDEVEAALDDVNLRRFLGVVRRLAADTQFLLITHQQPTVEIADTLFGVTMGPDGGSQIVARRLRTSVEGPARPYVRRALRAVAGQNR